MGVGCGVSYGPPVLTFPASSRLRLWLRLGSPVWEGDRLPPPRPFARLALRYLRVHPAPALESPHVQES